MLHDDLNSMEITQEDGLYYYDYSKLVRLNNEIIGFYTTHILMGKLTLEYNIFQKYRNCGLGTSFVNEVTKLVEREYVQHDKIYLFIDSYNIPSLTVAKRNGYVQSNDIELQEIIYNEMPNFYVYCKDNVYFNSEAKQKQLLHKL